MASKSKIKRGSLVVLTMDNGTMGRVLGRADIAGYWRVRWGAGTKWVANEGTVLVHERYLRAIGGVA